MVSERLTVLEDFRVSPLFEPTLKKIQSLGTDSLSYFGGGYTLEGGYGLQQNPEEITALILFLNQLFPPLSSFRKIYLEIGSASGGTIRLLSDLVGFDAAFALDDGTHPRAGELFANLRHVKCPVLLYRGDSHHSDAYSFLLRNRIRPENPTSNYIAFVDGDHSYEGVTMDIELVSRFCPPGTILILHDTVACDGVKRAWEELKQFKPIAHFVGTSGRPLGIGVARYEEAPGIPVKLGG